MEIFSVIWNQYLYIPLFNFLVWLYTNYASFNLGMAVIILTVILRIVLLPFTILSEKGRIIGRELSTKVKEIEKDYANDPVHKKQEIRAFLKRKKIRPWAKAIVLVVQGLVLVLLYRVFLGGINTESKLHLLYPSIPRPDFIDTNFFLTLAREVALGSALRKGDPLHYYLVTCEDRKAILVFLDGQQKPKGEVVKLRGTSFLVRH